MQFNGRVSGGLERVVWAHGKGFGAALNRQAGTRLDEEKPYPRLRGGCVLCVTLFVGSLGGA